MYYVVGLGNPGEKYHSTRHNVAWLIFDTLGLDGWKYDKYMNAHFVGEFFDQDLVLFIKPHTFMNKSGEIIPTLKKQEEFHTDQVIILYDDIDLPFGTIRISHNRGDGGHNGVRSLSTHLGTQKTTRIRIGISKKLPDGRLVKPNVLGNFPPDEYKQLQEDIALRVRDMLKHIVKYGYASAMNTFHTK